MKKTKIMHITGTMNRGGQETFIMNTYRNIDSGKYEFNFVVHGNDIGDYESEIVEKGGTIFRVTPKGENIISYFNDMVKIFKNGDFDIIHIHSASSTIFLDALIVKLLGHKNIVVHSHSISLSQNKLVHYMFQPVMNSLVKYRVGCSEGAIKWMFKKYDPTKDIVIKNSIDTDKYVFDDIKRRGIRERLNLEGQKVIGHVGRFDEVKNHKKIIEVFFELLKMDNSYHLVLVGEGALKNEIMQFAKDLGIKDKIDFVGLSDNVSDFMQAMDLFIFPSLYEGIPLTLIEAQSSGLPIYMSAHLPSEIDVTPLIRRIELEKNAKEWANEIIKDSEYLERSNVIELVKNAGFDIKENVINLEKFYDEISQK